MVNSKTAICRVLKILVIKEVVLLRKERTKGMLRQLVVVMVLDQDQEENKQVRINF
jgi:hypothetical protein